MIGWVVGRERVVIRWVVGYWVYWVVGIGDCDRMGTG